MLMLRQFGGPHQFSGLVGTSLVPSMERRLAAILIVDVVGLWPPLSQVDEEGPRA